MRKSVCKSIEKHPAVEEVCWGADSGVDYRYEVFLKEGWVWENGRSAGCRTLHCNTVADFKHANPIRKRVGQTTN